MVYTRYDKFWTSEFYNIVSPKDRVHDINLNELKLKVNDIYKTNEKKRTKVFEAVNDKDVFKK